jgi:hypothetical protein
MSIHRLHNDTLCVFPGTPIITTLHLKISLFLLLSLVLSFHAFISKLKTQFFIWCTIHLFIELTVIV